MENLEQPVTGSNNEFGKFKDAESLLRAYTSLEAEFTKKSQRLATLENEKEIETQLTQRKVELEKQVDDFVEKFDCVKPFKSALKETLINGPETNLTEEALRLISQNYKTAQAYAEDGEFLNNYIYSNKSIQDKIIKDYLSKVTQSSPIKVEGSSARVSLTPPKQPTTIAEAGKLAKTIIKNK